MSSQSEESDTSQSEETDTNICPLCFNPVENSIGCYECMNEKCKKV